MNSHDLSRRIVTLCGMCAIGYSLFQTSMDRAAAEAPAAPEPPKASQLSDNDQPTTHRPGIVTDKPTDGFFVKTEIGYMVPYNSTIPGSDVEFEMVPIPGGRFKMGSPETEEGRNKNEGPQIDVEIPPFWIAKNEVTWAEYKLFMGLYNPLKKLQGTRNRKNEISGKIKSLAALKSLIDSDVSDVDAITVPTPLYEPEITFELGEDDQQPAATMSPYAAKQYTKWLSLALGVDLRLPSEAEWEYASRAGTQTAYFFGNDAEQLGDYAWYYDNSDEVTHSVGQKKPNPWGIHDIYGNVAEWTLDQVTDSGYDHAATDRLNSADEAIRWPVELFPRAARGGHYDDGAEKCRSASRMASDRSWRDVDPNLPKSPWWLTDYPAHGVGFRLVRPLNPMTAEQRTKSWEATVDELKMDVEIRLEEGRGVKENVRKDLQQILKELKTLDAN